jgi:Cu-Zn family superoxide dismutase
MKNYLFMLPLALLFSGCSNNIDPKIFEDNNSDTLTAVANIMAKTKSNVNGTITFTEIDGKVKMTVDISGLTPGDHGIHIHAIGDCVAADGSSAGGHWNPTNVGHGKWGIAPFHKGDIGNILADSNGIGKLILETDLWCINCDDETKNIIGKAIIIHEGVDDYSSQPAGAAGDRIGCGKIMLE